jgi:hypothetical protein
MNSSPNSNSQLTNLQLELLKSLKFMANEKQLSEVKSLLRFYFMQQLDRAIDKTETEKDYSAQVYEQWLQQKISGKDADAA